MATDEELKALLGEGSADPAPPAEEAPKVTPKEDAPEEDPAVKAKREQLANLEKAVAEEQGRLKKARADRKAGKTVQEIEEDELPKINLDDPSAKAWDKRIRDTAAPMQQELEKAKEERRLYVLRQFLADKPVLAKDPAKVRAMMETYDRLKTSTELTSEGIVMDMEKAYAAEHAEELMRSSRESRMNGARNDAIFSDIGISRGSSTYSNPDKEVQQISLSDDEKAILTKWGMTPQEWMAEKKKFG